MFGYGDIEMSVKMNISTGLRNSETFLCGNVCSSFETFSVKFPAFIK
jgi:hypothetical protein